MTMMGLLDWAYAALVFLTLWGVWTMIILGVIKTLEFALELFEQW